MMIEQKIKMHIALVDLEPIRSLIDILVLEWNDLPLVVQERLAGVLDAAHTKETQGNHK